MSSLLDQVACKAPHGMLALLGSRAHPLVFEKDAWNIPNMPETFTLNPGWQKHRNELLSYLALAGLVSGGIGAGATGLSGLQRLRQMQKERPEALPGNVPVHMPISRMPPSEDEKTAEEVPAGHWKHLVGQAAHSVGGMPIAYAALPIASIAAMLGGSHLANKYMHNKMKALRQQRFEQSQDEFDQAMMNKYDSNGLGSEKLSAALDQLYATMEKDAAKNPPLTAQEIQALAGMSQTGQMSAHHQQLHDRGQMDKLRAILNKAPILSAAGGSAPDPVASSPTAPPGVPAGVLADPRFKEFLAAQAKQQADAEAAQYLAGPEAAEFQQWDAANPPPPPPVTPATDPPKLMDESSSAAVLGLPSIAAMLSGGMGLRAGYNWGEGRKPENLLRDALAQRAMLRSRSMPEPITLRPMSAPRKAAKQEEAKTTDE